MSIPKKRIIVYIVAIVAITIAFILPSLIPSTVEQEAEACIDNMVAMMRAGEWSQLEEPILELKKIGAEAKELELQQSIMESAALIEMTYLTKMDDEETALALFQERFAIYKGNQIELFHYDEILPFAKFHVLNLFLKRYDMTGAYWFAESYPAVTTGEYVDYFSAMDLFVSNEIELSLLLLESLSKKSPESKMIKGSIAYIERFKQSLESANALGSVEVE